MKYSMTIKTNLKDFYNTEAKKYAQTRQKPRKEAEEIFKIIAENSSKHKIYKILELGCGSGRFVQQEMFSELTKQYKIDYTGVDISKDLLKFAKNSYPPKHQKNWQFVCDDMLSFMKTQKQETADAILAFASFQHISTQAERQILMHYFYQTLKYWGILIMTNWAYSKRFRKKYHAACKKSFVKWMYSLWKSNFKDVLVPWKWKDKEFTRFYHLYSIKELKNLAEQAWFLVEELKYVDKNWQKVDNAQLANNSLIVLKKWVYC